MKLPLISEMNFDATMSTVAAGDLTERMTGSYSGLFAELQASVNETLTTLSRVVDDIAASCEALTTQASQMTEQSMELARRAEQQAASLEETSASMEEMASMTRQNAAHSKEARGMAEQVHRLYHMRQIGSRHRRHAWLPARADHEAIIPARAQAAHRGLGVEAQSQDPE